MRFTEEREVLLRERLFKGRCGLRIKFHRGRIDTILLYRLAKMLLCLSTRFTPRFSLHIYQYIRYQYEFITGPCG